MLASPLRRTIQTASLSFGPVLARKEVPFMLLPLLQEVSDMYALILIKKQKVVDPVLIFVQIGAVILVRH